MAGIRDIDTVLGENFLAIQSAVKTLARPAFDASRYEIRVLRRDKEVFVVFVDQSSAEASRDNFGILHGGDAPLSRNEVDALLAAGDKVETIDRIQATSLKPIEVGATKFLKQFDADLLKYRINLVEDDESLVTIFADKNREPGTRGHSSAVPGFEVEMRAKDFAVLRANFLR